MNSSHRRIERIVLLVTVTVGAIIMLVMLPQNLIEPLPNVDFTNQFNIAVTLFTATTICAASYSAMFFVQERQLGDLLLMVANVNLGINAFLHMIAHNNSHYSRYIEISAVKSDLLLFIGYGIFSVALLVGVAKRFENVEPKWEKVIAALGLLVLPFISVFLVTQPVHTLLLVVNQDLLKLIGMIGMITVMGVVAVGLVVTLKTWMKRRTSVPTGILMVCICLILAIFLKLNQTVLYQGLELVSITFSLYGVFILAVSLLGTSIVDPHWRR